jgi:hypothetical protein
MLLPEASPMFVAISDATVMSVVNVAVPVPEIAAGFGGGRHRQKHQERQYNQYGKCFSH